MIPLPDHYDLETIKTKFTRHPREILLLAAEGKLQVGVLVKNQLLLTLIKGKNLNVIGNNLQQAYDGAKPYTGFLALSQIHARILLNRKYVETCLFDHPTQGNNAEGLTIQGSKAVSLGFEIKDIFVERTNLENLSTVIAKKSRSKSDLREGVKEIYIQLTFKLSRSPSFKEVMVQLTSPNADGDFPFPITKVENDKVWVIGKAKSVQPRTIENLLTRIRAELKSQKNHISQLS